MKYSDKERLQKKLRRISRNLNDLLLEVREYYPDANYMVEGGVISVIPVAYSGDENYSETGSIIESNFINSLDCGMWN